MVAKQWHDGSIDYAWTVHFQQSCHNPPPRFEECKSWWVQGVAAKKKTSYF